MPTATRSRRKLAPVTTGAVPVTLTAATVALCIDCETEALGLPEATAGRRKAHHLCFDCEDARDRAQAEAWEMLHPGPCY